MKRTKTSAETMRQLREATLEVGLSFVREERQRRAAEELRQAVIARVDPAVARRIRGLK